MVYVLLIMSLIFIGVGFILTEGNAGVLLAGYNTMSPEDQAQFDLPGYVVLFRRFHQGLGISFAVIGLLLYFTVGDAAAGIFLGLYPFCGYLYFSWKTRDFNKKGKAAYYAMNSLLVGCIVAITFFLVRDLKQNHLAVTASALEIDGSYGTAIPLDDIQSLTVVPELPGIGFKVNGFGMGKVRKGRFKTTEGEAIRILADSETEKFLKIRQKSGTVTYYQFPKGKETAVIQALEKAHLQVQR